LKPRRPDPDGGGRLRRPVGALRHEKVETWLRQPFLKESADGERPRGRRLRYAVGELLDCTRCMGASSALGLVALRLRSPAAGRIATTVLAASAGNDVLQTAYSLLCARANAAREQTVGPHAPVQRCPASRLSACSTVQAFDDRRRGRDHEPRPGTPQGGCRARPPAARRSAPSPASTAGL
jgi:hypothetical protein